MCHKTPFSSFKKSFFSGEGLPRLHRGTPPHTAHPLLPQLQTTSDARDPPMKRGTVIRRPIVGHFNFKKMSCVLQTVSNE